MCTIYSFLVFLIVALQLNAAEPPDTLIQIGKQSPSHTPTGSRIRDFFGKIQSGAAETDKETKSHSPKGEEKKESPKGNVVSPRNSESPSRKNSPLNKLIRKSGSGILHDEHGEAKSFEDYKKDMDIALLKISLYKANSVDAEKVTEYEDIYKKASSAYKEAYWKAIGSLAIRLQEKDPTQSFYDCWWEAQEQTAQLRYDFRHAMLELAQFKKTLAETE